MKIANLAMLVFLVLGLSKAQADKDDGVNINLLINYGDEDGSNDKSRNRDSHHSGSDAHSLMNTFTEMLLDALGTDSYDDEEEFDFGLAEETETEPADDAEEEPKQSSLRGAPKPKPKNPFAPPKRTPFPNPLAALKRAPKPPPQPAFDVIYELKNKMGPLGSKNGKQITTKWFGKWCTSKGNKKSIMWSKMATVGFREWKRADFAPVWQKEWLGSCGVKPTNVPKLPTQFTGPRGKTLRGVA